LKIISKKREIRLRALAETLSTCDYDLICLQEVWVLADFQYIQTKVRHFLPYSHYFFAGFLGSGLAIYSKWPILSTSMIPYVLNGRPAAVWRGDWYAAKGAATVLIRHHTGMMIEVFNTHVCIPFKKCIDQFHAPYGKGEDTYMCHRIAQGWEIAKLMRGAVERGHFVIGVRFLVTSLTIGW
jgi:sphingomyelin phosphodiesterase 2